MSNITNATLSKSKTKQARFKKQNKPNPYSPNLCYKWFRREGHIVCFKMDLVVINVHPKYISAICFLAIT